MSNILIDSSVPALISAMEANAQELAVLWGRALGAEFHDESEQQWFISGLPFELGNGVVRAAFTPADVDAKIEEATGHFIARNVPAAWLVGPSTQPADLGSRLEASGWIRDDEAPGMAIDLLALREDNPLPPGLIIKEVSDGEMLKQWIRTMTVGSAIPDSIQNMLLNLCARYGFVRVPSVRYYLGLLDGEPVATSLLFMGGGVAGIYDVATLPEARGRRIGTALTVAPLLAARAKGYRFGILQSTKMGLNVYRRLGFQEYCTFSFYFWQ
ncbi:MAG TPA: GNAT family N-acetyltransferase [Ktedonobacteraceae bacterium]|nr:GNAT family N-acetyltransferase [Ktedonobacteraceae bacterium]